MANQNEPILGRFPSSASQDLIQVVSQGGGVVSHLNQNQNPWYTGEAIPELRAPRGIGRSLFGYGERKYLAVQRDSLESDRKR